MEELFSTAASVQRGDETPRPRLWLVHDLQGPAHRIRRLAEHHGADQPVRSFEPPLLRGEPNPFSSLGTLAVRRTCARWMLDEEFAGRAAE